MPQWVPHVTVDALNQPGSLYFGKTCFLDSLFLKDAPSLQIQLSWTWPHPGGLRCSLGLRGNWPSDGVSAHSAGILAGPASQGHRVRLQP